MPSPRIDDKAERTSSEAQLRAAIEAYLAMLEIERKLARHTLLAYRRELDVLFKLALAPPVDGQVLRIDDIAVRRWASRMHAAGLAPRSLARRLSAWRSFFAYLEERETLKSNPVANVRPPKIPKRLPKALSPELATRLVEAGADASPPDTLALRDHAIYELLYSSGLRLSELIDLDVTAKGARGYVDFEQGEVEVTGKGNKKRRVPVGLAARDALARWLLVRAQIANASENALFVSARGTRLSARTLQSRLKAHALARNIPANVHPHVLRHSFASHVLQSSGDLRAVQDMLGHATIASTQVYTSLDFQRLASVYDTAHPRAKRVKP